MPRNTTAPATAPAPSPPPAEPVPGDPGAGPPPPATASEALDRAGAAYEFGDIEMMVGLSRLVAEGALPGDDDQRAEALRLLGIGLYLDGRQGGAERVFADLVHLRPQANLDPSITRPEVVAFFRDVKRRNLPKKYVALAFLPPLGQFQNNTPLRGWILGGLEVATFGVALTTNLVLHSWVRDDRSCRGRTDPTPCNQMKLVNYLGVGALTATWAVGVIDALLNMAPPTEPAPRTRQLSLTILPNGAAIQVPF